MVMKSKSFNAVFCVPQLKLSINGLFCNPSMGGLFIFQPSPPFQLPVNIQPCEKTGRKFKLRNRSTWVACAIYPHGSVATPCVGYHTSSWAPFSSLCNIKF